MRTSSTINVSARSADTRYRISVNDQVEDNHAANDSEEDDVDENSMVLVDFPVLGNDQESSLQTSYDISPSPSAFSLDSYYSDYEIVNSTNIL